MKLRDILEHPSDAVVKTVDKVGRRVIDELLMRVSSKIEQIIRAVREGSREMTDSPAPENIHRLWHSYTEMGTYAEDPFIITSGEGARVKDNKGQEYIDCMSGLWCVNVGHGRSEISDAMRDQLRDVAYVSLFGATHTPGLTLAKKLADIAPGNLEHTFFANGGAEAVETALKMAKQFFKNKGLPNKQKILSLEGAWHGCSLGALSVSGPPAERDLYDASREDVHFLPFPDASVFSDEGAKDTYFESIRETIARIDPNTIAALFLEPIQGVGGVHVPAPDFFTDLQKLLKEFNILLIVDEISTGFGRTGKMFASEHFNLSPDMLTVGKGLTSGYAPLSAVLATDEIYEGFKGQDKFFQHGYTFGGHPLACRAALANIKILEEEHLPEKAAQETLLRMLKTRLTSIPIVKEVRGQGMMIAIELASPQDHTPLTEQMTRSICISARQKGLVIRSLGNMLPIFPPLTLTEQEMKMITTILADTLTANT